MSITIITPTIRDYSFLIDLGDSLAQHIDPDSYKWIIIYNSVTSQFFQEASEKLQSYFSTQPPAILYSPKPGKANAVHLATSLVMTKYFLILNDKDILLSNPLDNLLVPASKSDIGYCFPIKTIYSSINYDKPFSASLIDAYLSRQISGDQLILYITKRSQKYFFPALFDEPYLPEDVKHLLVHQESQTYSFIPTYILFRRYLNDGLTRNHSRALKSSPYSTLLYLYLTLRNISSLSDLRFFKVSIKIFFYQFGTLKRPFLTTLSIIVMLVMVLFSHLLLSIYANLILLFK